MGQKMFFCFPSENSAELARWMVLYLPLKLGKDAKLDESLICSAVENPPYRTGIWDTPSIVPQKCLFSLSEQKLNTVLSLLLSFPDYALSKMI